MKNLVLVVNRIDSPAIEGKLKELALESGMKFGGTVPYDSEIEQINLLGPSLLQIDPNNSTINVIKEILKKFL